MSRPRSVVRRTLKVLGITLLSLCLLAAATVVVARTTTRLQSNARSQNSVYTDEFVPLNGVDQHIQIRGTDTTHPVIVFLHGGPGGPSAFLSHRYQTKIEERYTMVNWDQRGSGRTWIRNENANGPVTTDQLLDDLDSLVDLLRQRFGQQKIIIMGHSWGTVLGTTYSLAHPEKVASYISVGQVVDAQEGERLAVEEAKQRAIAAGSGDAVASLDHDLAVFLSTLAAENRVDLQQLMAVRRVTGQFLRSPGQRSDGEMLWWGLSSPACPGRISSGSVWPAMWRM